MFDQIIERNSAKCKECRDEIESKHVHDFVRCRCGAIAVDGGKEYIRRLGDPKKIIETSIIKADPAADGPEVGIIRREAVGGLVERNLVDIQEGQYIFQDRPATKSSTNVVMKNSSCATCGCLRTKSRRKNCNCVCHRGN